MATGQLQTVRTSYFVPAGGGAIQWSTGQNFDGFFLVGIAIPTSSGVPWAYVYKGSGSLINQRIPQWCRIPIINGAFDPASMLIYNADLQPTNTQYAGYFYTNDGTKIAGPTTLFTITSSPTSITIPTLTAPTLAAAAPTPES